MMLPTTLRPAFLAVPLLLALSPAKDELGLRPKAGTELAKSLAIELELGLDSVSIAVNGQDMGNEGLPGLEDASMVLNLSTRFTDEYVKCAEGKFVELVRAYDEIGMRFDIADESEENTDVDAFEGKSVRFLWDAEKKEFARSWVGAEGDVEPLSALSPDMDVTCLLPEKRVEADDTWEASGAALGDLFFPGGLFPMEGDEAEDLSGAAEDVIAQIEKAFESFKVTCTYKGARDDGDVRVGEIVFQFDGEARLDLAEVLQEALAAETEEEIPDITMTAELGMKGEGVLLWDLAGGHLRRLTMEAELAFSMTAEASVEEEGQSFEVEARISASGQGSWALGVK